MKVNPHLLFTIHMQARSVPKPVHEYRFDSSRQWRFDVAWPDLRIAVELHGGVFTFGRHTRGRGFTADREKMNAATEAGWSVYEYTTEQVESGEAIQQIERVLLAAKRQAA